MTTVAPTLRIVFFGTPDFAVASLSAMVDAQCQVVAVVTTPGKPSGRGLHVHQSAVYDFAMQKQLPILQPEKLKRKAFLEELKSLAADLFVVVAFRMLPEVVWNMPPMGTINVHGSLLPKYRGAAPINHALINGETVTGVTTFRLLHEIDTGHILLQKEVPILTEDNAGTLYNKLKIAGANLLIKTINGLAENSIDPKPQLLVDDLPHAPKLHKGMMQIDWNVPVKNIQNLIRGLAPYPGAFTFLDGKMIKILESEAISDNLQTPIGSYLTDGKTFLKFAAKEGFISIKKLQPEGKKIMDINSFLRGYRFAQPSK